MRGLNKSLPDDLESCTHFVSHPVMECATLVSHVRPDVLEAGEALFCASQHQAGAFGVMNVRSVDDYTQQ